jgi:enoyl-CoA hydratase/carnithine racemase
VTAPSTGDAVRAAALTYRRDGAVAWITADNGARMNAWTAAMWRSLPSHVAAASGDDHVRILVLRGAGDKAFSAGADISEFESARTGDAAEAYNALNDAAFEALLACPKPTIAMIHGFCLGGGLAVALCCDLRLADEASQFAIPAAKLGIGYSPRWARPILDAVSPANAKELLFTSSHACFPHPVSRLQPWRSPAALQKTRPCL